MGPSRRPRLRLSCPADWKQFNQNCYKLISNNDSNWSVAEELCKINQGHLASIHSEEENAFDASLSTGGRFWIGGSDSATENVWKWSDGTEWDVTKWWNNEPNNAGGDENC